MNQQDFLVAFGRRHGRIDHRLSRRRQSRKESDDADQFDRVDVADVSTGRDRGNVPGVREVRSGDR